MCGRPGTAAFLLKKYLHPPPLKIPGSAPVLCWGGVGCMWEYWSMFVYVSLIALYIFFFFNWVPSVEAHLVLMRPGSNKMLKQAKISM